MQNYLYTRYQPLAGISWVTMLPGGSSALRKKRIKLEDIGQLICKFSANQITLRRLSEPTSASVVKQLRVLILEEGQHIEELPGCQEERGLQLPSPGINHGTLVPLPVWVRVGDPESIILTRSRSLVARVADPIHSEGHRITFLLILPEPIVSSEVNTGFGHEGF